MRRLLVLLATVAFGVWLAAPALSRPVVPHAVEFGLRVAPGEGSAEPRGWVSGVLRAPKRFDLVGLRWRAGADADARIRVRDASDGRWSPWTAMASDHAGGAGVEPVWAGGADAFQLRLSRYPRGLRAAFVNATGSATALDRAVTTLRSAARSAFVALAGASARAQDASGAPVMVPREQWGASQCRPRADPSYGSVQAAFVHHTVNANDYGPQDSAAIVLAICRYHRNTNGWRDIGYNFLVDRFGQIFEGRAGGIDQAVVGAQAQGYNGVSTGVANIGTFSGGGASPDAVQATAELLAWKLTLHGVPPEGQVAVVSGGGDTNRHAAGTPVTLNRISGHRDGDRTSCPGDGLFGQLPEIRRLAAQIAPALAPGPPPGTAVTLAAADATLDYPQPAQLAGRVTGAGGVAIAGAPVSIQFASPNGFATRSRTVSRADGTWSAQAATQYTRTLRAVARLPDGTLVASPLVLVGVAPRIGAQAPARVVAQRAFTVRGSVRPLRARLAVVVARRGSDGIYRRVASVPARAAGGRVRVKLLLPRAALHRLRIVSRDDARNLAGRSRDVFVRAARPRG